MIYARGPYAGPCKAGWVWEKYIGNTIRPFAEHDSIQVRELFVAVNRLLNPPDRRAAFEAYIERSLSEEIDRISDYYSKRDGGFWVAVRSDKVSGFFAAQLPPSKTLCTISVRAIWGKTSRA